MKHWLPYKLRFLVFKLEKYFGVFKDPKIRVILVFFLRYGSKVNVHSTTIAENHVSEESYTLHSETSTGRGLTWF